MKARMEKYDIGDTVLVEFLQLIDNTYNILYGVPVDVRLGIFNDETN